MQEQEHCPNRTRLVSVYWLQREAETEEAGEIVMLKLALV